MMSMPNLLKSQVNDSFASVIPMLVCIYVCMYVLYMYYHYALTKSQTHERHSVAKRQNCVPKSVMSAKMWQQTDGPKWQYLHRSSMCLLTRTWALRGMYVTTCTMP